jgi:OOP family OmpA-OmpF porin
MHLLERVVGRSTVVALALALGATSALALSDGHNHGRVVVTDTETTILDVVEFAPGTALLRPTSFPILGAVADTLRGNPSITLLEVQSHTSGRGDHAANLTLTDQRANLIMNYLIAHGIEPARLTAQGYGDSEPIDVAAPDKNERVSFLILQRRDGE